MVLDDAQIEFLGDFDALPGLSAQESRDLVAHFAFGSAGDSDGLLTRMAAHADALAGLYQLGIYVGRARQWQRARKTPDAPVETHPDLSDLERLIGDFERVPDVGRLHQFAQASLLSAIQRQADVAATPDDIRLLADAYLTLPPPGEDGEDVP